MDPVLENMYKRVSTRRYDARPVPRAALETLFSAAVQAPCGGNTQQWHFLCLETDAAKTRLNAAVRLGLLDMALGENPYKSMVSAKKQAQNEDYCCYYRAPVWIVVYLSREYPNAMADAALAVSNLMHAAQAAGLGTCWINQLPWTQDDPRVREVLRAWGVKDDQAVCASVSLGYPAQALAKPTRKEADVAYL